MLHPLYARLTAGDVQVESFVRRLVVKAMLTSLTSGRLTGVPGQLLPPWEPGGLLGKEASESLSPCLKHSR